MHAWALLLACLMVFATPAIHAGSPPPDMGSETNPELSDAEGDVQYDPLYVGPRDQPYIDTLAAWFDYDAERDVVVLTLKTLDGTDLPNVSDLQVYCDITAQMTDGVQPVADISFTWNKLRNNDSIRGSVAYQTTKGHNAGSVSLTSVESTFEYRLEAPAYFTWFVSRPQLQFAGVDINDPSSECGARQSVGGITGTARNVDVAQSNSRYEIADLHPVAAEPPLEEHPSSSTSEPVGSTKAPALGIAAVVFGFGVAFQLRRRRQP